MIVSGIELFKNTDKNRHDFEYEKACQIYHPVSYIQSVGETITIIVDNFFIHEL